MRSTDLPSAVIPRLAGGGTATAPGAASHVDPARVNVNPTEGQKRAGNYSKAPLRVHGLRLSVENPAGTARSGTAPDGEKWSQTMAHDYGYIRGTTGFDKDHIDVFLGPDPHGPHPVHVIDQLNDEGKFDEHKVMLGFATEDDAIAAYHQNYPAGWRSFGEITALPMKSFKDWAFSGHRKVKPVSELKNIAKHEEPVPVPQSVPAFASGGSVGGLTLPPLTLDGWLGGSYSSQPQPSSTGGSGQVFGTSGLIPGPYGDLSPGNDAGGSGQPGAQGSGGRSGIGLGTIGSGLGVLGNITGDRNLGMLGGGINALNGINNGQYGPAGAMLGGLVGKSPVGSMLGGIAGDFISGKAPSATSLGLGALSVAVPGIGTARAIDSLLGSVFDFSPLGWAADKLGISKTGNAGTPSIERNVNIGMALDEGLANNFGQSAGGGYGGSGGATGGTDSMGFGGEYAGGGLVKAAKALKGAKSTQRAMNEIDELRGLNQLNVIKDKGGNWSTFDNPLRPIADDAGGTSPLGKWHNKQLLGYMKNLMGTVDDPLTKLEAEGKLNHIRDLPQRSVAAGISGRMTRHPQTDLPVFPLSRFGDTDYPRSAKFHFNATGRNYRTPWENLVDGNISSIMKGFEEEAYRGRGQEVPAWLANLPPDARINSLWDPAADVKANLGLDHVQDYVMNALSAANYLGASPNIDALRNVPEAREALALHDAGLTLTPDQLSRTSVADAVVKTGKWNELMEAKRKEAQANRKMIVLKEYPNGKKWVELKNPGDFAAESDAMGHSVRGYEPPHGHPDWVDEAIGGHSAYGHGGWGAIKEGRARILSLRDAKGQPRATVEIHGGIKAPADYVKWDELPEALRIDMTRRGLRPDPDHPAAKWNRYSKDDGRAAYEIPARVTQIKGPMNQAPDDEYLSEIQDFVLGNVGEDLKGWTHVDDLQNAGMLIPTREGMFDRLAENPNLKHIDVTKPYRVPSGPGWAQPLRETWRDKMDSIAKELQTSLGRPYATPAEIDDWLEQSLLLDHPRPEFGNDPTEGFAGGGLVAKAMKATKGGKSARKALNEIEQLHGLPQLNAVKEPGGNWSPVFDFDNIAPHYINPRKPATVKWTEKQLSRYIRNQMGTAKDPLLKLEKEGRLHLTPEQLDDLNDGSGAYNRIGDDAQGAPMYGGDSEHQKLTGRFPRTAWEALSDSMIVRSGPDETLDEVGNFYGIEARDEPEHEWLTKLPADTPIYGLNTADFGGLRFDHVTDYLDQALVAGEQASRGRLHLELLRGMDGHQGTLDLIARNLHLTPDQLERSSVPDIVAKVSEWNKLLESTKKLGDMNKGVKTVHRTYPSGHQWVELDPEGLQAEGDAMRHCVGGYCSQVESGQTRILSLRDAKGQPTVTVEVGFNNPYFQPNGRVSQSGYSTLNKEYGIGDEYEKWFRDTERHSMYFSDDLVPWLKENKPDVFAKISKGTPTIRQIKGPANRAPSAEVLPHVQDLVRSGLSDDLKDWGEVQDLRNTGLINFARDATSNFRIDGEKLETKIPRGYYTPAELQKILEDQGVPEGDARSHAGNFGGSFASGGSVMEHSESGTPQVSREVGDLPDLPAAFGVFPQMGRRPPGMNDQRGAAELPLQLARGWVAGTAGLPGDIESLGRLGLFLAAKPRSLVDKYMDLEPALPTSEFYREWMPGATENSTANVGAELGVLMGGIGATKPVKAVTRPAAAAWRAEKAATRQAWDRALLHQLMERVNSMPATPLIPAAAKRLAP